MRRAPRESLDEDSAGLQVLGSLSSLDDSICTVEALLGSSTTYMITSVAEGECLVLLNGNAAEPLLTYPVISE